MSVVVLVNYALFHLLLVALSPSLSHSPARAVTSLETRKRANGTAGI